MQYQLKILEVELKEQFVTSHSKTNKRNNAYLQCQYLGFIGQSEVGLPPKNNITYFTDFDDVNEFFKLFLQTEGTQLDAFQKQEKYLKLENSNYKQVLNLELSRLDQIQDNKINQPAKALIECALFDWYSQISAIPISKLVSPENYERLTKFQVRNFFTISIADFEQTQKQIEHVLKMTNNLKIKVNDNLPYIFQLLAYLNDLIDKQLIGSLVFDCNCAWTPEIAYQFLHEIKNYTKVIEYIYMIEQPFPVGIIPNEWINVKEQYNQQGLKIFADESVSSYEDVIQLKEFINGINVKIEKSGGYRGALRILELAEKLNLQKWIGVMVGTSLNSNQAINLFGLVDFGGDADGNFLVTEQSEIAKPNYKFGEQQNFGKICI